MKRSQFLKVFTGLLAVFKLTTTAQTHSMPIPDKAISSTSKALPTKFVDLLRLLRCIAEVETENKEAYGATGERSKYQLTSAVWYFYSQQKYKHCNGVLADVVAMKHLSWLNERIPYKSPTERDFRHFALAYAWRAGLDGWNKHYTLPQDKKIIYNNYAVRVTNLYDDATFAPT